MSMPSSGSSTPCSASTTSFSVTMQRTLQPPPPRRPPDRLVTQCHKVSAAALDLLIARAWPAREHVAIGSWVARLDGGVSRRANSVLPHGAGRPPDAARLDAWIDAALDLYRSRSLVPWIQVSGASWPADARATARRARLGDRHRPTLLLGGQPEPAPHSLGRHAPGAARRSLADAWWELDARGGAPEREVATAILARISDPVGFAVGQRQG